MNIHNNENDPFEDVFRNRFGDFESEPNTQLWQKIEPQLPVNPRRKFPYWQTSAVVTILLLVGLWNYYDKHSDNVTSKANVTQIEKTTNLDDKKNNVISVHISGSKNITVSDVSKNTTNRRATKLDDDLLLRKPLNIESLTKQNDSESSITDKNKKIILFSYHNTTIEVPKASPNETKDNGSLKNNESLLNLASINNSNEKKGMKPQNQSNKQSGLSVFPLKEQVSVLNENYLTCVDSKSYSLLTNHFKIPKLKSVITRKKDDYFKEKKPLEVYASIMPLLNYYTITPNGNNANYVHSIAVNNDEDRLGFYTQAGVIFKLSDKFKLRSGLTFTKTNHSINYQIRTDSLIVQPSDRQGIDVSFEEKGANYSQVANYLGTKIEIQYTFSEGEALSHYISAGFEGAYRLNGNKQLNGFANFAYGVTRQIGDNAYLFIEPTFSYSLNQQSDNSALLLVKPNKIGFNIGVNLKIK